MKKIILTVYLLCFVGFPAYCENLSYSDATLIWQKHKDTEAYQNYLSEFLQFNNHYRLDEKLGCYNINKEVINMFLVVTHQDPNKFSVIEYVLTEKENQKSLCFKKTYTNLKVKKPPYLPFVIQMRMG